MKPMRACDAVESKIRFPVIAMPKLDGVRGCNLFGKLTGRSLKPFKNKHVTAQFSLSCLIGLDGEFAAQHEYHPDLCRLTSSAVGTIAGEPYVLWWLFDYVTIETRDLGYEQRLKRLWARMHELSTEVPHLMQHLRLMPWVVCNSWEEVEAFEASLPESAEGVILRDPNGKHKDGYATPTEATFTRIKRFVDFEFMADEIIEGQENQNEAQINELGLTFRSSHQENMVGNGMVGAMIGPVLDTVKDSSGKVLFEKGQRVRVGAGCMTHAQRKHYFENPDELRKEISKAKFFPKGIKDKPRFPTWQSFRNSEDM